MRASKLRRREGRKARSEKGPEGRVAKIVFASKKSDPSALRKSEVRFFQSGPSIERPNLRCCSGPRNFANACLPLSDSSRKPKLNEPCQALIPGFVVISTRPKPASWFSAAYGLRRKRISRTLELLGSL